jgi:hypothetical protein
MVAIEAREKKRQMFSKKDPMENTKNNFRKTNMFHITKYPMKNGYSTQKIRATPQFDLSLQALTKELELRQPQKTPNNKSDKNMLAELKENYNQEMKFISLRR